MSDTVLKGGGQRGSPTLALPLELRLALRDLRTSLGGFIVFVACIALGVMAIAGIGSLAGALKEGLAREGQSILGGDVAVSVVHRRVSEGEKAFLQARGAVSEVATLRAMARPAEGRRNALVRIKAADAAYPLFGAVALGEGGAQSYKSTGTAAAERLLLERLQISLGDTIRIGDADIRVTGVLEREPDQLSARPAFGPRIIMSLATLEATGLIQPGSLIRWRYRVKLADARAEMLKTFRADLERQFPDAGFSVRDRRDPNPRVSRIIDRFSQFMTLAGIATLMIGGIGVANAIAAYLARKRATIATFKCLGASGATIVRIYLIEVFLLAAIGTAVGLVAGALFPAAVVLVAGDVLPVYLPRGPQPLPLLLASFYGFLTALLFVLWPLGNARDVPPALLMRQNVSDEPSRPRLPYLVAAGVCAAALAGMAIAGAESRYLAAWSMVGLAALFVFYLGVGYAVERLARRVARPRMPELALVRASLSGPGSLARPVVLSLGAALSLLAAVSLVNTSLMKEFRTNIPKQAPSYYMLDIPREKIDSFREIVRTVEPNARFDRAPMLRGRIVRLNGARPDEKKAAPNARWVLNGDRGLTYADAVPEGSKLVQGDWWREDYAGPPLVSFEAEIAEGLGLKLGDTVSVNVLGRTLKARIANLRAVDWESLAINFVMVFSPNALAKAPHNFLATVTLPEDAGAAREAQLTQALSDEFAGVTALRVRDAIDAFRAIAERVMAAVRAAGGLTLVVGAVVLAGALGVAHPRRIRETVIFKTLGATRARLVAAHLIEYGLLALVAGLAAGALGTASAWAIVTLVMDAAFTFSATAVLQAIGLASALVLIFGAIGTWRVLGASPARQLRRTAG
ncbi:MAG: FtsX-like permease family protein [Hyphomicrobiales bacterium]|nr:FtsX-like permease family protein [Hyphomicrobiales bacterium]